MIDIGVRELVSPTVSRLAAVAVQQAVETLDDLRLRCVGQELQADRRERAVEVVSGGQRLLGHPYDGETAVVRHAITRAHGVDELGRQSRTDYHQFPLAAIEDRREPRSRHEL